MDLKEKIDIIMNKKVFVCTTTRADYGLLKPVILKLLASTDIQLKLVVTGMHLSSDFGLTYREIENDGIAIAKKIDILEKGDSPRDISKTMANALNLFGEYFETSVPDLLIVLGDRYETLAIACAAHNARIPIAHLYGGETTEGAVDEAYRHAITKMSSIHFTSTEQYRKRVIQLGEQPNTVFNVGSLGVENVLKMPLISKEKLQDEIGFDLSKPYAVGTFHPVTLENNSAEEQVQELIKAIDRRSDLRFLFTKANSDANGKIINSELERYAQNHHNVKLVASLGMVKYLTAVKYSAFVIGNSSSGLTEVPSFKVPTINIGDRQKGRIAAESVINCEPKTKSILSAIGKAQSEEFKERIRNVDNPYEKDGTSDAIVKQIILALHSAMSLKKKFYDINF